MKKTYYNPEKIDTKLDPICQELNPTKKKPKATQTNNPKLDPICLAATRKIRKP